jgi:hypothetical protein
VWGVARDRSHLLTLLASPKCHKVGRIQLCRQYTAFTAAAPLGLPPRPLGRGLALAAGAGALAAAGHGGLQLRCLRLRLRIRLAFMWLGWR